MASSSKQIEWCNVRLGEDMNWWVMEVSDEIHWDVDGLSVVDPRQMSHVMDLIEPLREYNFDQDILERGFIPFRIDKDLGEGIIRLVRTKDTFLDADEPLFGLPDVVDEENGPFADFLDHITKIRVAFLNDMIDFEQKLTVDELEDEIREAENNSFIEGKAIHLFNEVTTILDYVPSGWELDSDEPGESGEGENLDEFPDLDEDEEAKKLGENESLKWDEDDEKEETENEDVYEGGPPDEEDEEEK